MQNGFIKVGSAIPFVKVADCQYNISRLAAIAQQAEERDVEITVFPEMCITGYTCADLFLQPLLVEQAEQAVKEFVHRTAAFDGIFIIGAPVAIGNTLFNMGIVVQHGTILGMVPKTFLPGYREFNEKRWFATGRVLEVSSIEYAGQTVQCGCDLLFQMPSCSFGIEICEDLWSPTPPSTQLAMAGADLIFNLSATDEVAGKNDFLKTLLKQQSARLKAGYIYSSCGFGESTTDLVFGGNAIILENGNILAKSERFSFQEQLISSDIDLDALHVEHRTNTTFWDAQLASKVQVRRIRTARVPEKALSLERTFCPTPFIPSERDVDEFCEEMLNIQVSGLATRLSHIGGRSVVIGISGGLDSTLALLVAVRTFDKLQLDRKGIVGITMPGFGTTGRTRGNAWKLMEALGITCKEISIAAACTQHFKDIDIDPTNHDTTYENTQARERTQILMDYSNKVNAIVVGTGDLSELALGWCTYNGDHMSMYGVNAGIPKTVIQVMVRHCAATAERYAATDADVVREALIDIVETPISPELLPGTQPTENFVGPYELNDFFLYHFIHSGASPTKILILARTTFAGKYDDEVIKHWLKTFFRRFFAQQFKRSCMPDGPKVSEISLSPRGDWKMPSDISATLWLAECEKL